jgi:hypothetical protein
MSSPTTTPPKYKKLNDDKYNLDCPNPSCSGWLNFYAKDDGSTTPEYVNCIFKNCIENMCTVKIILSKFDSTCRSCKKEIVKVIKTPYYYVYINFNITK